AFSPDSSRLAVCMFNHGDIQLFDTANGKLLARFSGPVGIGSRVRFLPDGLLISASYNGDIWLWDTDARKVIRRFAQGPERICDIALSKSGKLLATFGDKDRANPEDTNHRAIRIWDVTSGTINKQWCCPGDVCIRSVSFSSDDRSLAVGFYADEDE